MLAAALERERDLLALGARGDRDRAPDDQWLKEMLGYPADAAGLFTSGGSMANFAALAAARSAKSPVTWFTTAWPPAGQRMCAYVSDEGHFSIRKAAGMLGIGEANVRDVRTNERQQIDLADLERLVDADLAAGHLPFCVVANAGTTATGAFDPIGELADFARRPSLAARGCGVRRVRRAGALGAASVRADRRGRLGGARSAQVALPAGGNGCVLYKDPAAARAAFSHDAEYTRMIGLERDEAFAFWDYGPELSRPFRAFDLWLLIKYAGAAPGGGDREQHRLRAAPGAAGEASEDFEMLAPVELSIFCFRYARRASRAI